MEQQLGRPLAPGEVVHHIDLDKQHNKEKNLWLTDGAGHRNAHWSLQLVGAELVKAGLVQFDREEGKYVANLKLRELLEHPGEGNQQPSPGGDAGEGSETRREAFQANKPSTSAGRRRKRR